MRITPAVLAVSFIVMLGSPVLADAASISIDFATAPTVAQPVVNPAVGLLPGNSSSAVYNLTGGVQFTVDAYSRPNGSYVAAPLFRRRDGVDDNGFGVCNPNETASCGNGAGGGTYNELDNLGTPELIRLSLPSGFKWVSVGLSSLDGTERGQLYSDADGNPNTTADQSLLTQFEAGADASPSLVFSSFAPGAVGAQFLFLQPVDWRYGGSDNDYLIQGAVMIPEPSTLLLVGSGLLVLLRRRRS